MTKEVRERLEAQLTEIHDLIEEINTISSRLKRAADTAVEIMSMRDNGRESDGSE